MNELQFLYRNEKKWNEFNSILQGEKHCNPDKLCEMFVHLTDDLAYARTNFPDTHVTQYLNELTTRAHQLIYRNRINHGNKIVNFWKYEFPLLVYSVRKQVLISFLVLFVAALLGAVSNLYDQGFARIILGDRYLNMTLQNIQSGDPLAVYKSMNQVDMFLGITVNNIRVAFLAFALGILSPLGPGFILFRNGVMLGTFQTFFVKYNFLVGSVATIWVHGTLEIFAIIVAGAAGIVIGNSIVFPHTYSRIESFRRGAVKGSKIAVGLVPVFVVAGFLESFVTRYTHAPYAIRFGIILLSLAFIVSYFYIYPKYLNNQKHGTTNQV